MVAPRVVLLLLLALPLASCTLLTNVLIAGQAGRASDNRGRGSGLFAITGGKALADHGQDGGYEGELRLSARGLGVLGSYVRMGGGSYGADGKFGNLSGEVGLSTPGPLSFGLTSGLGYGGYPRSALSVPIRLLLQLTPGPGVPFGGMASLYAGWRWGGTDDVPAADKNAIGWRTYGASVDVLLGSTFAFATGFGWDRQDDVDIWTLRAGIAFSAAKQ